MASKRRQRYRQCERKRKYPDRETAIRMAMKMRRLHPGEVLDAFMCKTCSNWHVGHRPKAVRQSLTNRRNESA